MPCGPSTDGLPRAHRATQTHSHVARSVQTWRESGIHMSRKGLWLDPACGRLVAVRSNHAASQLEGRREAAVRCLQRMWRGHCARRIVRGHLSHWPRPHDQLVAWKPLVAARSCHKTGPTHVSYVANLYNEVAKWRQTECLQSGQVTQLEGVANSRDRNRIVAKERPLLQSIDRLNAIATKATRKERIDATMQRMARPKLWQMSDGGITEVHTPRTLRARELYDLYHDLQAPPQSVDDRLNMLRRIKSTVQAFECALTRQVVALLDREADMLSRGRKEKSLEGLRQRLATLFLQLIET